MQDAHPLPAIDIEPALGGIEQKMGLTLSASAARSDPPGGTTHKVLVITGGPGVGKTTLVRGILEIFLRARSCSRLCAPTGRAAKRLAGDRPASEAKTHPSPARIRPPARSATGASRSTLDLLIVDETSMVDIVLMNHLLRALPAARRA